MEKDKQIINGNFVNEFVQTPETEGIIGSMYISSCLEGFRGRIIEEMKTDLMEFYSKNRITEKELDELMQKYINKIPEGIMLELYGEIIRFIQGNN